MTEENKQVKPQAQIPSAAPAAADSRPFRSARKRPDMKRKVCRLCADKVSKIDYKNSPLLKTFTMDSGKMLSRRISGLCAKHQRQVCAAVKRNRNLAILPYTTR